MEERFTMGRELRHGRDLRHLRELQLGIMFHLGKRATPWERASPLEKVSSWKESFTMLESFNMGERIAMTLYTVFMCLCNVLLHIAHFQFGTVLLYELYDQNLIIVVNRFKKLRTVSRPFWKDYLT